MHRFNTLTLIVLIATVYTTRIAAAGQPPPTVDIRTPDGTVLLADNQIRSYDFATHTLTLAPKAREALAADLHKGKQLVRGVPFVVAVNGKAIYAGAFTSTISSGTISSPVIVIDLQSIDPTLGSDQVRIQLGYPGAAFHKGEDPRSDPALKEALRKTGKLARPDENVRWLAAALREMQNVKPGMTRADLLKVFAEEGGLSTRAQRRYAYRDCPYIKVDVTFEPVGRPDEKISESPDDKVTQISKPFLEWSIED